MTGGGREGGWIEAEREGEDAEEGEEVVRWRGEGERSGRSGRRPPIC